MSIPAGTNFENAIALVAKLGPGSKWNVQGGVVVFLPDGVVPPLLQVQIQSFAWDKSMPVREVLDRIRQLPEVTGQPRSLDWLRRHSRAVPVRFVYVVAAAKRRGRKWWKLSKMCPWLPY